MIMMNQFFAKYEHLRSLHTLFTSDGVTDDTFFSLSDAKVNELVTDGELLHEFVSKYNLEKQLELDRCLHDESMTVDPMEVDECESSSSSNLTSQSLQNLDLPEEMVVGQTYEYVQNDLYHLLNSSFEGQIVLNKYQHTKDLDYSRLKDIIVLNKIQEDSINFKIKKEYFNKIRGEAEELFATEDPDILYIPRVKEKDLETPTKGCLYNHYKTVRSELRLACKLPKKATKQAIESIDNSVNIKDIFLKCLTDCRRDMYDPILVQTNWKDTFDERCTLLDRKEKKVHIFSIETYFRSFACLDAQFAVILLEADFRKTVDNLISKQSIPKETNNLKYNSLFTDKWSSVANAIISSATRSRNEHVKNFLDQHQLLLETDNKNLLALFLLPLSIQATQSVKVGSKVEPLTKDQLSKCFILHVLDINRVDLEIATHSQWLIERKIDILPYLVFGGPLPCTQFYLVLNGVKYSYAKYTTAVEACFKCITVLRRLPAVCDYVWSFIERVVYSFTFKKARSQYVTQYANKINNILSPPK